MRTIGSNDTLLNGMVGPDAPMARSHVFKWRMRVRAMLRLRARRGDNDARRELRSVRSAERRMKRERAFA